MTYTLVYTTKDLFLCFILLARSVANVWWWYAHAAFRHVVNALPLMSNEMYNKIFKKYLG